MSLEAYEAAAARACLSPEADPADLAKLGSAKRWTIYRSMVRTRMRGVCRTAAKRTVEALGEATFDRVVDDWFATAPPTTRFFRELPSQFARFAVEHALFAEPAHAIDLLRYEIAVWEVKAADDRDLPAVVDFSFEGTPCFSPAAQLVEARWGVDRRADDGSVEPLEGALLVFRDAEHRGRCIRLNPMAAAIVRELQAAEATGATVTDAIKRAADDQGVAIDQKLIEGLSALLEKLLTRGVLRGCLGSVREMEGAPRDA